MTELTVLKAPHAARALLYCLWVFMLIRCDCGSPPVADASVLDAHVGDAAVTDAAGGDNGRSDASLADRAPGDNAGRDHRIDRPDPNRSDNDQRDSDCDGLSDAEEYGNVYGGGQQTDPADPDSDGDGLLDGLELGRTRSVDTRCDFFTGDQDSTSHTDPTRADSDGDGLLDGDEDRDHNGARDSVNELDPRNPDSDGDGLCDGVVDVAGVCVGGDPDPLARINDRDRDGLADSLDTAPDDPDRDGLADSLDTAPDDPDRDGDGLCDGPRDVAGVCRGGEDLNADGVLSAGETDPDRVDSDCDGISDAEERSLGTDPRRADSDGDLISDGVELGRATNLDSAHCSDPPADANPGSSTDPLRADSDGDGINDGVEDRNRNGRVDSDETDPESADSDGDGICDGPARVLAGICSGGEDLNGNGRLDPGESDPRVAGSAPADTDADGLPDENEQTGTCPDIANPDSDGDGLCDGRLPVAGTCGAGEDRNGNGRVDPGESNPCRIDSDCDGLVDGSGFGGFVGEDDVGTSATNPDSDGDGVPDGVEAGVASNPDPNHNASCGFVADADPGSTTNPTLADSDGDGVLDGAEDGNRNGRVDCADGSPPPGGDLARCPGGATELDPGDGNDIEPAVQAACGSGNLVPVDPRTLVSVDQQVLIALRSAGVFAERSTVTDTTGAAVGQMGFDATRAVAYLALTLAPAGSDAIAEEVAGRALLASLGSLSTPITYTFTTWDGYPAVHASYDLAGSGGVKARAKAIVEAYVSGALGALPLAGDIVGSGGFKIAAEFMRRSDQTALVLMALVPTSLLDEQAQFYLSDLSQGSSLGQAADAVDVRCDRFTGQAYAPVDIIWAVDNSVSMAQEQAQVFQAATALGQRLSNATIDWRNAEVSSGFWQPRSGCSNQTCGQAYTQQCRPFTNDIGTFAGWFNQSDSSWIGAGGSCNVPCERIIHGLELMLSTSSGTARFVPVQASPGSMRLRQGTNLVLILLGDADDQKYCSTGGGACNTSQCSSTDVAAGINYYENFFRSLPDLNDVILGGILCPDGSCGELQNSPHVATSLIDRFGGVRGTLSDAASIEPTINAIVDQVIGRVSPYHLSEAAIASTLKVAISRNGNGDCQTVDANCPCDNLPRSRSNGFDYDPASGDISFFGDCRPAPGSPAPQIAVSYRHWVDRSPDPDPSTSCNCSPPEVCDPVSGACYCPPDCGQSSVPPEQVCNTTTCQLECRPDCGAGCHGASVCDASTCACVCPPDCGGASPGGGFACNRDAASATFCTYVCNGCVGSPPSPNMNCDLQSCTWQCPACANCPGLSVCNTTSCACDCQQSLSCNPGFVWDATACDCVCDTAALGCDGAYAADAGLCACVCRSDCGNICEGSLLCNPSLCACIPVGG